MMSAAVSFGRTDLPPRAREFSDPRIRHIPEATATIPFQAMTSKDVLTDVVRAGAQRMLAAALEAEVGAYIESLKDVVDEIGSLEVRQPRVKESSYAS
jgi:hypothetical protein